jgi:hypothetical protein
MPVSAAEDRDELHVTATMDATQESKNIDFMQPRIP